MYATIDTSASPLTFDDLLKKTGWSPTGTVLIGHSPAEPAIRDVLPWLVESRPDVFENYQSIQSGVAALTLRKAQRMASFIKLAPDTATFAGFYEVRGAASLSRDEFWQAPGLSELKDLGYVGREQSSANLMRFDLAKMPVWSEWIGKLVVWWPKGRAVVRRADNAEFGVQALHVESSFARSIPPWKEVVLTWAKLQALPPSWRAALTQWRGIYFIYDTARQLGYVGSAAGAENLLGRWRAYAATGHGGNVMLRESRPQDLRFSILELTSPDLAKDEVVDLERDWMARLHTREFGLNAN